jgi:hypothetical protein
MSACDWYIALSRSEVALSTATGSEPMETPKNFSYGVSTYAPCPADEDRSDANRHQEQSHLRETPGRMSSVLASVEKAQSVPVRVHHASLSPEPGLVAWGLLELDAEMA